jgi:hypothetical protein
MSGGLTRWMTDVSSEVVAGIIVAGITGGCLGYIWRYHLAALLLVGLVTIVIGTTWAASHSKFMPHGLISVVGVCLLWPIFVGIDNAGREESPPPSSTIDSTPRSGGSIEVRPESGLATIECPTGGEHYGSAVPLVRGTAQISLLADDQELWLASWSEAPGEDSMAAYLSYEITTDTWEQHNLGIAEPQDFTAPVELRVYVLTPEQLEPAIQRVERGATAGPYLREDEINVAPLANVQIVRNTPGPASPPCR